MIVSLENVVLKAEMSKWDCLAQRRLRESTNNGYHREERMKLLLVAVGKTRSHGLKLQQGNMDEMLLDLLEWLEELSESWPSKAEVSALQQIAEPR